MGEELEWREARGTHKIHAFKKGTVTDHRVTAICGIEMGSVTVPLEGIEDLDYAVSKRKVCILCYRRGRW
jgi:hypothetical protein